MIEMTIKIILKYLLIVCSMFFVSIYSSSYWEIVCIGVLCAITLAIESLKNEIERDQIDDTAREIFTNDNFTSNEGQLTERNRIDHHPEAAVLHEPSLRFPATKIIPKGESVTPLNTEKIGDSRVELTDTSFSSEVLIEFKSYSDPILQTSEETTSDSKILDSPENFNSEEKEILIREELENKGETTFLASEVVIGFPAEKNLEAVEKLHECLNEKPYPEVAPILLNSEEKYSASEIISTGVAILVLEAENVEMTPESLFEKSCPQFAQILFNSKEKEAAREILNPDGAPIDPTTECKDTYKMSPSNLDEKFHTESSNELPVENHSRVRAFVDEVASHEIEPNCQTLETSFPNKLSKFQYESHLFLGEKSPSFLEEKFYTESSRELPVENHNGVRAFADEVASQENEPNCQTLDDTSFPDDHSKFQHEYFPIKQNLDCEFFADIDESEDDTKFEIGQSGGSKVFSSIPVNEINRSKTSRKENRVSKFQAFKNRLLNIISNKKSASGSVASSSVHVERPKTSDASSATKQNKVSKPKKKRRFTCCGCFPY